MFNSLSGTVKKKRKQLKRLSSSLKLSHLLSSITGEEQVNTLLTQVLGGQKHKQNVTSPTEND